jgi:hypothetical protein
LRKPVFLFGVDRGQNQLTEKAKALDACVVKTVSFGRKGFDQSDNSPFCGERDRNHGACAESAASLRIYAWIRIRIVAANRLAIPETGAGKSRIGVQANTRIRGNTPGRSTTNDCVFLYQGYSDAIGTGYRDGTQGDQTQHFIQSKVLVGGAFRRSPQRTLAPSFRGLFVDAGER